MHLRKVNIKMMIEKFCSKASFPMVLKNSTCRIVSYNGINALTILFVFIERHQDNVGNWRRFLWTFRSMSSRSMSHESDWRVGWGTQLRSCGEVQWRRAVEECCRRELWMGAVEWFC